jgi:hypothetical protein
MSTEVALTASDLRAAGLEEPFAAVEEAVEGHLDGSRANVAVVADPFAGRATLLDHVEQRLGAATARTTLSEPVLGETAPLDAAAAEVVLVDDCQYLYTRQVGGFDPLDDFLERTARSSALYVTAWNRYAWSYVSAVRDVEDAFSVVVRVPPLDAEGVRSLITSVYGPELPAFVETEVDDRVKTVDVGRGSLSVAGRSVPAPRVEFNPEYLAAWGDTDAGDAEAVVFEKLTELSDGNPGVAAALWERSVRDGEIAPEYVTEVDRALDVDDDEAFVLEVLLAKERVDRTVLSEVLATVPVERSLGGLVERGLLAVDGDDILLEPELLHATVEHLRGQRFVW